MHHSIQTETTTLGQPVGVYQASLTPTSFLVIFFMAGTAFFSYLGLAHRIIDLRLLAFVVLEFGAALYSLWLLWHQPHRLLLFEQGIVVERLRGRIILPWEHLKQIRCTTDTAHGQAYFNLALTTVTQQSLHLRALLAPSSKQAVQSKLSSFNLLQAARTIAEASQLNRLQIAQTEYSSGAQVDFRTFQLSTFGFRVKRAVLPWSQVSNVTTDTDATVLAIWQHGQPRPWKTVRIAHVPNADILVALLAKCQPWLVDAT